MTHRHKLRCIQFRLALPYTTPCEDLTQICTHTPWGWHHDSKCYTLKNTKIELCLKLLPNNQPCFELLCSCLISLSCKYHIQLEPQSSLNCHTHKTSLTSNLTVGACICAYLDSAAIDTYNPHQPIHQPGYWQNAVCFINIQDILQNDVKIVVVFWNPKSEWNISISNGLACDTSSKVMNYPLISHGILCTLWTSFPISPIVSSGGTIQAPALFQWALSICNCSPIVPTCCPPHCACYCWCLCQCCATNWCSTWTVPCNVPHYMAYVALLSIPPIGAPTFILLIVWKGTVTLTVAINGLQGFPSLHIILCLALHLQHWEPDYQLQTIFLWYLHFMGFHPHNPFLQFIGKGIKCISHPLGV